MKFKTIINTFEFPNCVKEFCKEVDVKHDSISTVLLQIRNIQFTTCDKWKLVKYYFTEAVSSKKSLLD